MKKIYLIPSMKADEAQVANMLAESLAINNDPSVDGGSALTKENSWDIWTGE